MNNRRPILLSFAMLILAVPPADAQPEDSCSPVPTALVLSGGGSAGMAHVGVIRALDERGFRPDWVVGASIGAVVGGMYASGYSGGELDSLVRVLPLDGLFRGYAPRLTQPLKDWPALAVFEQRDGGFDFDLSMTRENEANALLSYWLLRGNLEAGGDFDALPIPFRAIATDLVSMETVVLAKGDLAQAVRASMSIPLVFSPVEIDGHWLADGGLSANIPIGVARSLGAKRVIVSDVTERLRADTLDLDRLKNVAKVLTSSLFDQEDSTLLPNDILIRADVDGFPKLDFSVENKSALIERGYAAAVEALNTSSCLPRAANGRRVVALRGGSADNSEPKGNGEFEGSGKREDNGPLLGRSFGTSDGDDERLSRLRSEILESGSLDQYEAVWLHPQAAGDSVVLRPQTIAAAPRLVGLGFAYDNELGVRAWLGGLDRRLLGDRVVVGGVVALGRLRQELELNLRGSTRGLRDLTPVLSVGLARESIRRFAYAGLDLPSLNVRELHGFLGVEKNLGSDWIIGSGMDLRAWDEPAGNGSSAGLALHIAKESESEAPALRADASRTTRYSLFAIEGAWPLRIGSARLTPEWRYGWGRDLPPHLEFALGGDDGFPGLHIGERRGMREALLRVGASHPLAGPISMRLELASGATADGGRAVPSGDWRLGARVGLSLEFGFCPIRIAYGWTDSGREALFFRVGRWF